MGFFNLEQQSFHPTNAPSKEGCVVCGLHKSSSVKQTNVYGNGDLVSFTFRPTKNLPNCFASALHHACFEYSKDEFMYLSALGCNGRMPNINKAVQYCSGRVNNILKKHPDINVVIVHGAEALSAWFSGVEQVGSFQSYRGIMIPDLKRSVWVYPVYDSKYLNSQQQEDSVMACYNKDVDRLVAELCGEKTSSCYTLAQLQEISKAKDIVCTSDYLTIKSYLENFSSPYFFFDIETTGLKPFATGHRIVSFACSGIDTEILSFPLQYTGIFTDREQAHLIELINKILANPKIKKVAHNAQFEDVWCRTILKSEINNWYCDTFLYSKILDNRNRFSGLKHQAFVRLGLISYDSHIKPFLDSGNAEFNNIESAPFADLLYYGGMDILATRHLYVVYNNIVPCTLLNAYNIVHKGTFAFGELQINGMHVNVDHYIKADKELTRQLKHKKEKIQTLPEALQFKKVKKRNVDIASPQDLGILLYDILQYPPVYTEKNNYCVDVDALNKIDTPFVTALKEIRKLEKIKTTYLAQFFRNITHNRIHAMFGLGTAVTYRSNSSNPNWQNIPIRDKVAKEVCRGGLIPSKGNMILEADYSGVEVRIGACYHKDKNMVKYITDPTTDMHRDTAADLWMLPTSEITKEIRQSGKGDWVFPQFYGSWYLECGKNAWDTCIGGEFALKDGTPLYEHIRSKGIKTKDEFIEHCKNVEQIFWGKRFKGYANWRKEIHNFYLLNGYIETYLGFRYQGYMTRNETSNYPIQGTAFHCLLMTLIRLMEIAKEEKWQSKFIGQIHDSLLVDLVPEEKTHVIKTIYEVGTTQLMENNPWIIVPIDMDFEITEIDQPWSTKQEI